MKKLLLLFIPILLIAGCTPSDPLPEALCTSGIYDNTGIYSEGDIGALGEVYATEGLATDGDLFVDGNEYIDGSIVKVTETGRGGYWHKYSLPAKSLSPGASGATLTEPNAQTLGGYLLDADNEYLYYAAHIEDDWDELSNILVEIYFETNEDNALGDIADTVDIDITCYNKTPDDGEYIPWVNSFDGTTTIGTVERYALFTQEIEIDSPTCNIETGECIIIRINFDTTNSEIGSIIVNYLEIKYQTSSPAMEVS